jgi:hypothetical protein
MVAWFRFRTKSPAGNRILGIFVTVILNSIAKLVI